MNDYDVEYTTAIVDRESYVKDFRDVATFEECCRQCPNYERRWGCPPYSHDTLGDLLAYEKVLIIGAKMTPHDPKRPLSSVYELMDPELELMNGHLLALEKEVGGLAFGFAGKCRYCKGQPCARIQGEPCRHPEVVRPSLEAYGFNIALTAERLLGMPIEWSHDGMLPRYLTLVCGLFFNGDDVRWQVDKIRKVKFLRC